ncbi:mechanosensitive ion channel family protein [Pseudoduganella albidiflava]|uniref:Mechanosensitive ion channel n=1 Tax=Pseudoduganella albidiflava TaxID=321983 RepID=A0A411WTY9_9BURK|nr:mechanosensitive ion channel domain-containing protein [Pseudoduganella albidiflava]QBI00102.1 mechanosensitive ion channel [Pseudoduganella albidiflava]GGY64017.1 mechanosensitive ion channel protein MscS [Pseudoduganella albidiflava]
MKQIPLSALWNDLLGDLRDAGLMWQLGALVLSVGLGWMLSRLVLARLGQRDDRTAMARFGVESFARVIAPLAIVLLLWLSQIVLGRWYHVNLLKVALPIWGSLAVIRLTFYLLRRVFARRGEIGAAMLTFEKIFQLLVWVAFALYITGYWDDIYRYLDRSELHLGKSRVTVAEILQGIVSVVVTLVLAMWAGTALEERLMGVDTLNSNVRVVLARVGRALLIVVAVLFSLNLVGIDLTVLSVFGGALGVGLGLGLQKIASNYVSGFIILLDRSLQIGDMITVDKYSGRVARINTRYTVLQGLDGVESIVPNEMFVSSAVQNTTLTNKEVWLSTKVFVSYDTDLDFALKLLEKAAATVPRVLQSRPPGATLLGFAADGLELQVGFWIGDPENGRGGVTSDVNRAIWKALKEHEVMVPYPAREMRIIGAATAAVQDPEIPQETV